MPLRMIVNLRKLKIDSSLVNDYQVLQVRDDLTAGSDLGFLREAIQKALAKGGNKIAIILTEDSTLHTQTIAILVQCIEMVHRNGGELVLVNPNDNVKDVLETLSLDKLLTVCSSEEELKTL